MKEILKMKLKEFFQKKFYNRAMLTKNIFSIFNFINIIFINFFM